MRIRFSARHVGRLAFFAALVAVAGGYGYRQWLGRNGLLRRVPVELASFPLTPLREKPWIAVDPFPGVEICQPTEIQTAPGDPGTLYVLERPGRLRAVRLDSGHGGPVTALDISDRLAYTAEADDGALGFVFHPQFAAEGEARRPYLYLFYTAARDGKRYDRLSRFTAAGAGPVFDPATELVLIDQLDEHIFHNGGGLAFGPDGFLYVGFGDEGMDNDFYENSQRLDRDFFTNVLRIDVDERGGEISAPPTRQPASGQTQGYFIPRDNPFVGRGGLEEPWCVGMRNPHRLAFDPATGDLWCSDVGQDKREEIDLLVRGGNGGWSFQEGNLPFGESWLRGKKPEPSLGQAMPPFYEYPHLNGDTCVIGGFVYRGQRHPELSGKYLFGDNTSGRVWALDLKTKEREELIDLPFTTKSGLAALGQDAAGNIYLCVLGGTEPGPGRILRLQQAALPTAELQAFPRKLSETGIFADLPRLTPAAGVVPFEVNTPLWSDGAVKRRWIVLPGDGQDPAGLDRIQASPEGNWRFPVGAVLVKHFDLPLDERNPALVKKLETRLLIVTGAGSAYGVTYKWDDNGLDAELLSTSLRENFEIQLARGGTRRQTWHYPGRGECMQCHTQAAGFVLGVSTRQLNRDHRYPSTGRRVNQLLAWSHAGLLAEPFDREQVAELPRLAPLDASQVSLEDRARSYLDANCSYCHRPGGARANFDARFSTPLAEQGLIDGPLLKSFNVPDARLVAPGRVSKSMLLLRMMELHPEARMPQLGTLERDNAAIDLLARWIDSLPVAPSLDSVPASPAAVPAASPPDVVPIAPPPAEAPAASASGGR